MDSRTGSFGLWAHPVVRNAGAMIRLLLIYFVLSLASFLMLRTIIGYTSFRTDVQFLLLKQAYIHNPFWKTAFYIHVFSAIVALLAGFTQFSRQILQQHKQLHRLIGKIYVIDILVVNFPAGMIMGIYANGGLIGKTAFILLDCLWFWFTYKAYATVRKRDFVSHREYMIRSYALTFSAITLRTWKIILSHAFVIDLAHLYVIDAWMGFVPNLLIAEWIIRSGRRAKTRPLSAKRNAAGYEIANGSENQQKTNEEGAQKADQFHMSDA
jgi:uncharacterized membrane protein